MKRLLPATVAFVLTVAVLVPSALSLPQHGDEAQYGWSAAYFGGKLAHLDFWPHGSDLFTDPGWSPSSYWSRTQPMGARYTYALALGFTGEAAPALPYSYTDASLQGPEMLLAADTLIALRLWAIVLAAVGLALFAARLGWPALCAIALFLVIPDVRVDLSRAWAEGPLLFGLGLAAAAYGTRWLPLAAGVAATMKLTALPLWLVAFHIGLGKSRYAHFGAIAASALTWTVLTPPSWFAEGPLFLLAMTDQRLHENSGQAAALGGSGAMFVASRYLWPFELAVLLSICVLAPRVWHRLRSSAPTHPQQVREQTG